MDRVELKTLETPQKGLLCSLYLNSTPSDKAEQEENKFSQRPNIQVILKKVVSLPKATE